MWIIICLFVILITGLYQMVTSARTAASMGNSRDHLKNIGVALHNYHYNYTMLPASAIVDEEGVAHHGWMYAILRVLDSNPLSEQIDSNRPWNDGVNLKYSQLVLPCYLNPAISQEKSADGFGLTHYAGNSHLFQPNESLRLEDITDGLGATLMVGEVNDGFQPWAKPGNTRDPALGLNKGPETFGSPFQGGVHFMMGNGSVRFISDEIDPQVLKALATPDGGENIEEEW